MADTVINFNPQPGMWAATGTAIAYAPTIGELREPENGGANIEFDEHGHSARTVVEDNNGELVLARTRTRAASRVMSHREMPLQQIQSESVQEAEKPPLAEVARSKEKHRLGATILHGLHAFWKFFITPTGFLITLYGINIVAWGAMLFFLELKAAPAMNHPSAGDINSPRKKWLEIDSQILNALFCVTGFGLAPWRFRDLWYLMRIRISKNQHAMKKITEQNASWFRPPTWANQTGEATLEDGNRAQMKATATGKVAPPTKLWKLDFVVWMMVLNTANQAVLSFFMWGYNRINRPGWATGTFIGVGCGVAMLAGLMSWWEARKVKRIEGPVVKVIDAEEMNDSDT